MQDTDRQTTTAPSVATLRNRWEQQHGRPAPSGLGKDLLTRAVAWNEQARSRGDLARTARRELVRLAAQLHRSGDLDLERQPRLKPGTRLVREWHGDTYHVTVLNDGYLFQEKHYSSLSYIAQVITGVKWSGPRFFGLERSGTRGRRGAAANG